MLRLMRGARMQDHRRCGQCGKHVRPWRGSRKCDGWHWHRKCWADFLTRSNGYGWDGRKNR